MNIAYLPQEQRGPALDLAWETFLAYEAPDYSPEGAAAFQAFLRDEQRIAALEMWGAYDGDGALAGMIATRSQRRHISLFFVDQRRLGQGVGKQLFQALLPLCPGPLLTVNSSPYAVPAYERLGFIADGPERQEDGIRYIPMTLTVPEQR